MKKKVLSVLILVLILCISLCSFTACGKDVNFKLKFIVDNETYATIDTSGQEVISMPENPTKEDYTFDGWFWDKDVWEKPFTANSLLDAPLSGDMSVYAKFTKVHLCDYGAWVTNNNGTHTKTCINDNTHKETKDCNGGTATCQAKAVCVDCNSTYGNFANCNPDTEWTATETHHYHACKTQGCTEKLDNEKHTFDKNKKCTVCDYITTALMGTEISSDIYEIDGTNLFVKVPNTQSSFTFAETIEVAENATYRVFTDINCKEIDSIPSYAVNDLKVENNTYYFLVSNGNAIPKVYTVTVRRRPMYTVNFVTNGGTSVQNQTIEEDSFVTEPTTTKIGYTFVGWDYDFSKAITDNTTISASWNINQYTLTIKYNNEQEDLVLKQDYNTDIQTIANPEKLGYTFTGWDKTIPSKMSAEDLTINATWKINQYTLRIVYGNGQEDLVLKQDYDTAIQTITNPEKRVGYTFTGWDNSIPNKMPAKNLTINATWQANEDTPYRVEYYFENLDNDNYSIDNNRSYNTVGKTDNTASITPETIEHYTLNRSMSVLSGNIDAKETLVLKVYYKLERFTISAGSNGEISNRGSQKYGKQLVCVATPILGYEFVGWYSGEELLSTNLTYNFTVTQDVVAKFELKQEMSNFNFTSTVSTCKITGVKDKTVTEIIVPDYVTEISSGAFSGCSKLVNITIPFVGTIAGKTASDTYQYPFGYIFGTSSYTGGTSTTQYYYGSSTSKTTYNYYYIPMSLKSVTIIGGYIPYGAFYNYSSLTSVVIGDSVTSIGGDAFYNCSSLTKVNYLGTIDEWVQIKFGNAYANPIYYVENLYVNNLLVIEANITNTTKINSYAFYNCSSLTSVTIGNSVTSIGGYAFEYCRSLTSVTIGYSVTSIGNYAFSCCSLLTSVTIGNSVTSIGSYAFYNCSSLTSVTKGYRVKSIGDRAFYNCSSLTSIEIPNSVTSIGWYAFYNCSSLTSVTIGDSVTSIGGYAFAYCSSLTSVTIGNSVTRIDEYTFSCCSLLTSIVIPNSVTSIVGHAFAYCSSLTSVTIGNGVTNICSYAFYDCSSLTSVTFRDTTTWYITKNSSEWNNKTGGTQTSVTNSSTNATYFKSTYKDYYWYKI